MIAARLRRDGGFATRLAARAQRLAEAASESRWRAEAADAGRWRRAALLWPLFTSHLPQSPQPRQSPRNDR